MFCHRRASPREGLELPIIKVLNEAFHMEMQFPPFPSSPLAWRERCSSHLTCIHEVFLPSFSTLPNLLEELAITTNESMGKPQKHPEGSRPANISGKVYPQHAARASVPSLAKTLRAPFPPSMAGSSGNVVYTRPTGTLRPSAPLVGSMSQASSAPLGQAPVSQVGLFRALYLHGMVLVMLSVQRDVLWIDAYLRVEKLTWDLLTGCSGSHFIQYHSCR